MEEVLMRPQVPDELPQVGRSPHRPATQRHKSCMTWFLFPSSTHHLDLVAQGAHGSAWPSASCGSQDTLLDDSGDRASPMPEPAPKEASPATGRDRRREGSRPPQRDRSCAAAKRGRPSPVDEQQKAWLQEQVRWWGVARCQPCRSGPS